MITPKEKAKQLTQRFELIDREQRYQDELNLFEAKQCALICVDECIKEHCHESEHKDPLAQDRWIDYWQKVKKEINKL